MYGRPPRPAPRVHRQIYRPLSGGRGIENTVLCSYVRYATPENSTARNEAVDCKRCRKILDLQPEHPNRKWLDFVPTREG